MAVPAKIAADPTLRAAYERRRHIADTFLAMIREAYAKRRRRPPFDDAAKLETALRSAGTSFRARRATRRRSRSARSMPAPGAERQWPRLRGPDGQGNDLRHGTPPALGAERERRLESRHSGPRQQFTGGVGRPDLYHDRLSTTAKSERSSAIARPDGKLLWQAGRTSFGRPGESLHEKYVRFVDAGDGRPARDCLFRQRRPLVRRLRRATSNGTSTWGSFPTMHGPGTSPVLYKDEVICIQYQTRGKSLFAAFDKRTGARLWQQEQRECGLLVDAGCRSHRRSRSVGLQRLGLYRRV